MRGAEVHVPPDYADLRALDLPLCPVDVGNALREATLNTLKSSCANGPAYLAEVELGILLVRDTLNLEEGGVGAGVALRPLVAKNAALRVKSGVRYSQVSQMFSGSKRRAARERDGVLNIDVERNP